MSVCPPRIGFVATLCLLALGCAKPSASSSPEQPFAGQTLNVFNWSDYIDPELIPEFERRTGAKVQYDNYSSESELETKLLAGGGQYDVIFPSDRSMAPLVKKGLLAELDKSQLSNWKHLDAQFLDAPYDKGNRYSAPYFWGTLAVGIRTDHVKEPVKDFSVLFNERYRGRITMLDDAENTVAAILLYLHHPMNSTEDAHLAEVQTVLQKQKPLVQAYTSDAYKEKLLKGEAWVALGWSGDILQARREDKNIQAIIPETGTMKWVDSMAIPKGTRNPALAHAFINYLLDPEIAARNANFVQYATPNKAAQSQIDPKFLQDPAIYPSPQVLDHCEWLLDRGPAIKKIEKVWQEIRQ